MGIRGAVWNLVVYYVLDLFCFEYIPRDWSLEIQSNLHIIYVSIFCHTWCPPLLTVFAEIEFPRFVHVGAPLQAVQLSVSPKTLKYTAALVSGAALRYRVWRDTDFG